jgi:Porin subfamily
VKVCSLYGAGFYYIPGSDTCLKIGGFLRTEWNYNAGGSLTTFTNGANALFSRGGDVITSRSRAVLSGDVREQTAYGTVRAYFAGGWQYTSNDAPTLSLPGTSVPSAGGAATAGGSPNANGNAYLLRAFIQFGGFTLGKTASFFDFFVTSKYTNQTNFMWQEYAGVGVNTWGYTQDLGNGISASAAIQDNTQFAHAVKDLNASPVAGTIAGFGTTFPILASGGPTNGPWDNTGNQLPDIVANLRIDQAWGTAQIMGGLHDNRARYYESTANGIPAGGQFPADKWGYAAGAGFELNLPWWSKGDSFAIQSQYCVGFSESCYNNSGSRQADLAWGLVNSGTKIGLGWVDDAYLANTGATGATGLQLPTMWNVVAAVQHYWVPNVRTSLYGAYVNYKADSSAVDTLVCAPSGLSSGCANWAAWQIGSRTVWSPTRNLDIGVEALYSDLSHSAFSGATVAFAPASAAINTYSVGATHIVSGIVRAQYNFYP